MKSMFRTAIMASIVTTMALSTAQADEAGAPSGYYVGGGILGNFVSDNDISGTGFSPKAELKNGYGGILTFGHNYDSPWRGEIELGARKNSVKNIDNVRVGDNATVYTGMANLIYDIDVGSDWTPYMGGGLGIARGTAKISNNVNGSSVNENDTTTAVQFIAGTSYNLSSNWQFVGQYNLLTTPDRFEYKTAAGDGVDYRYTAHSMMFGLRYSFGVPKKAVVVAETVVEPVAVTPQPVVKPAPAVAPAPTPAPPQISRNFLVFFDWDSDVLTPEALAILTAAADNAKMGQVVQIDLTGHADTSGTQGYNMKLSNRRALVVKSELVRLGLGVEDIMTSAKGEMDPLVSTGDGVREPQNRRVEIMFD